MISTQVRALEAWVHLFPFREAHTHTCIAPHAVYWSGEYDDEASELRHRRERLLALRRARAAAADDGAWGGPNLIPLRTNNRPYQ